MRSSGSLEELTQRDVEEFLSYFSERFGIPRSVFSNMVLLKKGRGYWVFTGDPGVLKKTGGVEAAGVRALTKSGGRLKPSTVFLRMVGRHATKNVVELESEEDMVTFMTGGIVKKSFNVEPGYVVVKYKGDVLGCGSYSPRVGLISQIPKHLRVEAKWFRTEARD